MVLSPADAALFFRLMRRLLFYVKQQQQLLPEIESYEEFVNTTSNDLFLVRTALWKSPELIGSYEKENPDGRHRVSEAGDICLLVRSVLAGDRAWEKLVNDQC